MELYELSRDEPLFFVHSGNRRALMLRTLHARKVLNSQAAAYEP